MYIYIFMKTGDDAEKGGCKMSDGQPQYKRVIDYILSEISEGRLKQGDRIPSEKKLSEQFSMSRQTIRHATGELEKKGVITRVRGSGSYIGGDASKLRDKFMTVAVMLTYVDNYIFPQTVRGISDTLEENGYSMQLSFTDNDIEKEQTFLKKIIAEDNVDALLAEPSKSSLPNPNMKYYRIIQQRGIPIEFINSSYPKLDIPCVRLDDEKIGYEAVRYLIENGHRQIAGIFHCEDSQGLRRFAGYDRALREADIVPDPKKVLWLDTDGIADVAPLTDYILSRIKGATAIFTYNDEVGCQLIDGFAERGINVPDDISVISVDDSDLASKVRPGLTTFPHPKRELGITATDKLLAMIDNPIVGGNELMMPDLVVRDSVKLLTEKTD